MKKVCSNGHTFEKSSNCPICPICEKNNRPKDGFLSLLPAPAKRALLHNNIQTLEQLANYSEQELLQFHGFGKKSIPILQESLAAIGLKFKV